MSPSPLTPRGGFLVAPDHPALAGHFPGAPVVPGVVLVEECLHRLLPPGARLTALPIASFLAEVGPGDYVTLAAAPPPPGPSHPAAPPACHLVFEASCGGRPVLRGTAVFITEEGGEAA